MNRKVTANKTHRNKDYFNVSNLKYWKEVDAIISTALKFDLGEHGDITTKALGISSSKAIAEIHAKEDGIIAGIEEIKWFLNKYNKDLTLRISMKDGQRLKKGELIMKIEGSAGKILKLERTLLNFLQRLSGIATLTDMYVKAAGDGVLVCPTRKTFWGALDKKACILGGGGSHRINLNDAILIKDNHLEFFDYELSMITKKLSRAKNIGAFIEIEVETHKDTLEICNKFSSHYFKVPIIVMLDNMSPEKIKKVITDLKKKGYWEQYLFEASGGINLNNIKQYAKSGVDIISIGALTHSAPGLDISMDIKPVHS